MTLTDLIILVLATSQIIETYHHGSIFAPVRARIETWPYGFWYGLLTCMFCLSHWVSLVDVVGWVFNPFGIPHVVLTAFAVTRGAQLVNDWSHHWCRTPNRYVVDDNDVAYDQDSHEQNQEETAGTVEAAGSND